MRDRLIDILNSIQDYGTKVIDKKDEHYGKYTEEENVSNETVADKLLADGWFRPPCKIGDTVYTVLGQKKYPKEWKVVGLWQSAECWNIHTVCHINGKFEASSSFDENWIGKTVFLTKEEAEQALRKEDEGK